ncbi:MAG: SMC-Scp complex subunit ScpB [Planctomyces sp.]|nr:SMC-Scp complex subunit ScpB [Planctomyces sp.]
MLSIPSDSLRVWGRSAELQGRIRQWLCRRPTEVSPRTVADQLQRLPDGGLVRSQRLARVEAALLISGQAISPKRLAQLARLEDAKEAQQLIQILNESYDRDRTAFRVEQTASGYVLMTRAQYAPWLDRLHQRQASMKLSGPAMETLTIIAYQQPVTRADVEAVRGVQSSEMIRQLIDRGLVRVAGEDDSLGRPFLYETTRQFLSMFGLQRLEDMPNYSGLRRQSAGPVSGEGLLTEEADTDEPVKMEFPRAFEQ